MKCNMTGDYYYRRVDLIKNKKKCSKLHKLGPVFGGLTREPLWLEKRHR